MVVLGPFQNIPITACSIGYFSGPSAPEMVNKMGPDIKIQESFSIFASPNRRRNLMA